MKRALYILPFSTAAAMQVMRLAVMTTAIETATKRAKRTRSKVKVSASCLPSAREKKRRRTKKLQMINLQKRQNVGWNVPREKHAEIGGKGCYPANDTP